MVGEDPRYSLVAYLLGFYSVMWAVFELIGGRKWKSLSFILLAGLVVGLGRLKQRQSFEEWGEEAAVWWLEKKGQIKTRLRNWRS